MTLMFLKYVAKLKDLGELLTRCLKPCYLIQDYPKNGGSTHLTQRPTSTIGFSLVQMLSQLRRNFSSSNQSLTIYKFLEVQAIVTYQYNYEMGSSTKKTTIKNDIIVVNRNPINNSDTDLFVQRKHQSNKFSMILYKPSKTQLASNNKRIRMF